jgi:6,7-dimethyl-8-ribityllumazine synthase
MSNIVSTRPGVAVGKRAFTIVASRYNSAYVQGLIDHATAQLRKHGSSAVVTLHHVPGAFEIPIVAREIALQKKTDAIIAIGVIIKGKTDHAEHLARAVTDALQRIAVEHGVPIINAVLSMKNEAQARERCLEDKINRGSEAAHAAMEIVDLMSALRGKQSHG